MLLRFQSSPGTLAGCNERCQRVRVGPHDVSILTRHAGRVQRDHESLRFRQDDEFQSSPGTLAGCNPPLIQARPNSFSRFNPHPARWPGATREGVPETRLLHVSILTRHAGRVQPARAAVKRSRPRVSILTRHAGRVQRAPARDAARHVQAGFNPHPARWPGATRGRDVSSYHCRFQSSPGTLAGCNDQRTQDIERLQQFQSSPGTLAGCNGQSFATMAPQKRFNPHPARWPGATCCPAAHRRGDSGFNPHPARWPGATFSSCR